MRLNTIVFFATSAAVAFAGQLNTDPHHSHHHPKPSKRATSGDEQHHRHPRPSNRPVPQMRDTAHAGRPSGHHHHDDTSNFNRRRAASPEPTYRYAERATMKRGQNEQEALTSAAQDSFDISSYLCPGVLDACPVAPSGSLLSEPISLAEWIQAGFECVDFATDLKACGGCSAVEAR